MEQVVCTACGYVGKPAMRRRGRGWLEIALWLMGLLPGLIYTIWRLSTRHPVCPSCAHGNIVSAGSPAATAFLAGRSTGTYAVEREAAMPVDAVAGQPERRRPASIERSPQREMMFRRLRALAMTVLIVVLALLMFQQHGLGLRSGGPSNWTPLLLMLVGMLAVVGVIVFGKKARRHAQPRLVELDTPPGVLYLRPFEEDADFRVFASWGADRHQADLLRPRVMLALLRFHFWAMRQGMRNGAPPEFGEIVSRLTQGLGRVAAIGEPGSPPVLGVDNVYVSDDGWQAKVLNLARGAKLVILTAGTTPGVLWEVENILREVPPSRLVLNIPGMTPERRRKRFAAFRDMAGHLFPHGLPGELKARAIAFEDDWTPVAEQPPLLQQGTAAHLAWWLSRALH